MVTKKEKTPAQKLAGVENALPYLKAEIDRLQAIYNEMAAAVSGGATIGDKVREITDHWKATWEGKYQKPFAWGDMATMTSQIKKLIKELGVDELKTRISNYIGNENPYLLERRHPWALFLRDVNEYAAAGDARRPGLSEPPEGCKHDPPCRDQFEHTRRRQEDLTK